MPACKYYKNCQKINDPVERIRQCPRKTFHWCPYHYQRSGDWIVGRIVLRSEVNK